MVQSDKGEKSKVRDIMSTPIITEDEDTVLIRIARDMADMGIGSVVITREGKLAGIITERDIALKVLLKDERASEIKAKEVMSTPVLTISPEASVEEACELASAESIKRLPVVENDVPIGIISIRNLLTLKPEYVKRLYPKVRILASGWTLDRLERSLSDCEVLLAGKSWQKYIERLREVYDELGVLVNHYIDDKELREIFDSFGLLYHDAESKSGDEKSQEEQREKLEKILKKFRHSTYWRKQQSTSSYASGIFRFHDYRHGTSGKGLRLPFKRTRP